MEVSVSHIKLYSFTIDVILTEEITREIIYYKWQVVEVPLGIIHGGKCVTYQVYNLSPGHPCELFVSV